MTPNPGLLNSVCALPCGEGRGGGGGGKGEAGEAGQHLLLELAELGGEAVDADAGLLQLLVGGPHQVAVPLRGLPGIIQLAGRTQG